MARASGKFGQHGLLGGADALTGRGIPAGWAGAAPRVAAVDLVRSRIAAAIALGQLRPGQRLPDQGDLAAAFDVSEITLRRALESLCADGILGRRRGRSGGTFVSDPLDRGLLATVEGHDSVVRDAHRLVDQRLLVESGVLAHVARRIRTGEVTDADRPPTPPLPPAEGHSDGSAVVDGTETELAFHSELARLSGVATAAEQVADLVRWTTGDAPTADPARPGSSVDAADAADDHDRIWTLLVTGREDEALRVLGDHLRERAPRAVPTP